MGDSECVVSNGMSAWREGAASARDRATGTYEPLSMTRAATSSVCASVRASVGVSAAARVCHVLDAVVSWMMDGWTTQPIQALRRHQHSGTQHCAIHHTIHSAMPRTFHCDCDGC